MIINNFFRCWFELMEMWSKENENLTLSRAKKFWNHNNLNWMSDLFECWDENDFIIINLLWWIDGDVIKRKWKFNILKREKMFWNHSTFTLWVIYLKRMNLLWLIDGDVIKRKWKFNSVIREKKLWNHNTFHFMSDLFEENNFIIIPLLWRDELMGKLSKENENLSLRYDEVRRSYQKKIKM